MSNFSMSLFQSTAVAYSLATVVVAFVLLFIPSLLVPGAKPHGVARAISCYLWKTVGLIIIAMSIVQLAYNVIGGKLPEEPALSALILLFVTGIGTMIQASRVLRSVDEASVVVVRLVFSHTCEVVGGVIALMSALSLGLSFLMTNDVSGWEMSATTFLLGITTMLSAGIHIKHKTKVAAPKKAATKRKR